MTAAINQQKKFREMSSEERFNYIFEKSKLSELSKSALRNWAEVAVPKAENHLSYVKMAVGVIPEIRVNGKSYVVPLITEEPSVIAGVSNAVKMAKKYGGFRASASGNMTIGQVQVVNIPIDLIDKAIPRLKLNEENLFMLANEATPRLVAAGGGIVSMKPKKIDTPMGPQIIVDFNVDCKDAMGANAVSKMAESMAQEIASITGGEVVGRILSNLAIGRAVVCDATFDKESLALKKNGVEISGERIVEGILHLGAWAQSDQLRATTHNKGIMNGIDALALATGQDSRAIEAAAHSYTSYYLRHYGPFSSFRMNAKGDLEAHLEMLIPVGVIGGALAMKENGEGAVNPSIKACLEITGCTSATELAALFGAVGLAQNVAALRMLCGEGLSQGHIEMHKKRIDNAVVQEKRV